MSMVAGMMSVRLLPSASSWFWLLSLRANKFTVKQVGLDAGKRDLAAIDAATVSCFDSADYAEGRRAFMEKRKPVFTGR